MMAAYEKLDSLQALTYRRAEGLGGYSMVSITV